MIFPYWRLPVAQAVCFLHPFDQRPVFIFPWEGVTIVGTTDVDHHGELDTEPVISSFEVSYLLAAVEAQFPSLNIHFDDIISTFSGVRPVIGSGKTDPSQESRDHMVWCDNGLITVTGGKLTTFRLIALEVLNYIRSEIPEMPTIKRNTPALNPIRIDESWLKREDEKIIKRLFGRYGKNAENLLKVAETGEMDNIPGTDTIWAEIRWAARSEYVCHLDDLMLRRVRLGLILPQGGKKVLEGVQQICQSELTWDDEKWEIEVTNYLQLWNSSYYLPENNNFPELKEDTHVKVDEKDNLFDREKAEKRLIPFKKGGAVLFLAGLGYIFWKKRRIIQ